MTNNPLLIPVSFGELVDKITILSIKQQKITDLEKLKNIENELCFLLDVEKTFELTKNEEEELTSLMQNLYDTNLRLWQIENELREMEKIKCFDETFIEKARSVYILNDSRFIAKNAINKLFNSTILEEKSYKVY